MSSLVSNEILEIMPGELVTACGGLWCPCSHSSEQSAHSWQRQQQEHGELSLVLTGQKIWQSPTCLQSLRLEALTVISVVSRSLKKELRYEGPGCRLVCSVNID